MLLGIFCFASSRLSMHLYQNNINHIHILDLIARSYVFDYQLQYLLILNDIFFLHAIFVSPFPNVPLVCHMYLVSIHNNNESSTPFFDLDVEHDLQQTISSLIKKKLILSAHDVADGGLFITLLECSMYNNLGFNINCLSNLRKDAFLFGESPSRVVVSVESNNKKQFEDFLSSTNTIFNQIGSVTSGNISVDNESFGDISEYKNIFNSSIAKKMK